VNFNPCAGDFHSHLLVILALRAPTGMTRHSLFVCTAAWLAALAAASAAASAAAPAAAPE
jgi:hypothetical protein